MKKSIIELSGNEKKYIFGGLDPVSSVIIIGVTGYAVLGLFALGVKKYYDRRRQHGSII